MHVIRAASGTPVPSTASIFTGEVAAHTYVDDTIGEHLRITLVRFSAGGRTKWHRHAFEQALVITEGAGIVATESGEEHVGPGDIVVIPADEKHWHGGTNSTSMAHLSIVTPGETTILDAVVD